MLMATSDSLPGANNFLYFPFLPPKGLGHPHNSPCITSNIILAKAMSTLQERGVVPLLTYTYLHWLSLYVATIALVVAVEARLSCAEYKRT